MLSMNLGLKSLEKLIKGQKRPKKAKKGQKGQQSLLKANKGQNVRSCNFSELSKVKHYFIGARWAGWVFAHPS